MASNVPVIDWPGESGRKYRYSIYPRQGTKFKAIPGNYVFAKRTQANRWSPVYIGQTSDLSARFLNHHQNDCIDANGATHIHVHASEGDQERLDEETDIRRKWDPACNKQ